MRQKHKGKIISVEIEGFSKKGNGLGHCDLWTVEVPFTMKGDCVQASLLQKRRGRFKAKLEEVESPASNRIGSKCEHFGLCGGCRWQHVPYEAQLEEKRDRVKHHYGDLWDSIQTFPIIPCDPPWNYRNKMEFSFSSDAAGTRYLGLMMEGGKGRVFHLTECHLCSPWFVETLKAVREWWNQSTLDAYHPYRNTGALRTLTLREGIRTGDKMVILTVSGNPDYALIKEQVQSFVQAVDFGNHSTSIFLRIHQIMKGQPTQFYEMLLKGPEHIEEQLTVFGKTMRFKVSPSAFFQPNTRQAEKLYQRALEMADIQKEDVVYDLYCGTGTLGLCAAQKAARVVGVELVPEAILDARENAKLNDCENIEFFKGSVSDILAQLALDDEIPRPDIVLVDPPRAGLDQKSLDHLCRLNPRTIVYVSCNPATQAENVQELLKAGYRLELCQPVDQFPHTVHIENIVVLKRSSHEI